jgi:hypothetical protein
MKRYSDLGFLSIYFSLACEKRSHQVISFLALFHLQALGMADANGNTPLLCCLLTRHRLISLETACLLIKRFPQALTMPNKLQEIPLHQACLQQLQEIIGLLANFCPQALKMGIVDGNIPLHLLCRHHFVKLTETIRLLVTSCPEAVIVANHRGFTLPASSGLLLKPSS